MTAAALHELRSEAVPLIKEHLWLADEPPPSPDKRPWSIARDLSVWNRLVDAGYDPEHLNGAISVCREVARNMSGPKTLCVFYWRTDDGFNATPFLERCIAKYLKKEAGEDRRTRRAQFDDYLRSGAAKTGLRFLEYGVSATVHPADPDEVGT